MSEPVLGSGLGSPSEACDESMTNAMTSGFCMVVMGWMVGRQTKANCKNPPFPPLGHKVTVRLN